MGKNKILDYLSAVQTILASCAQDAENDLYEEDDGESHSVDEGKKDALWRIDASIQELQALRIDVTNKSYKDFCAKHGIDPK